MKGWVPLIHDFPPFFFYLDKLAMCSEGEIITSLTSKRCQTEGERQRMDMFVQGRPVKYVEKKSPREEAFQMGGNYKSWPMSLSAASLPGLALNQASRTRHGTHHLGQSCKVSSQYATPNALLMWTRTASDPHINRRQWFWQNTPTTLIRCDAQVRRCNCLFMCILYPPVEKKELQALWKISECTQRRIDPPFVKSTGCTDNITWA